MAAKWKIWEILQASCTGFGHFIFHLSKSMGLIINGQIVIQALSDHVKGNKVTLVEAEGVCWGFRADMTFVFRIFGLKVHHY